MNNPDILFDVNKLTEFRVTLLPSAKLQLINSNDELKFKNDELFEHADELFDELKAQGDELNGLSEEIADKLCRAVADKPGLQKKRSCPKVEYIYSDIRSLYKTIIG